MLWLKFEFIKLCTAILFILWIYLLSTVEGRQMAKRGIIENINSGIKYAGQMMGINTAADVANLVAKAFAPQITHSHSKQSDPSSLFQTPYETPNPDRDTTAPSFINTTNMVGDLLRMLGFDAGKLGALAINALLMIAQLIGTTLRKRQHPNPNFPKSFEEEQKFDRPEHHEDEEFSYDDNQEERAGRAYIHDNTPLDWILTNPPEGLSDFVERITDRELPDKLVDAIGKLEQQNGQGDCIKLLMCKSAIFIWGMQNSVSKRLNGQPSNLDPENYKSEQPISALLKNLPDIDEYRRHGEQCERRYSQFCN